MKLIGKTSWKQMIKHVKIKAAPKKGKGNHQYFKLKFTICGIKIFKQMIKIENKI